MNVQRLALKLLATLPDGVLRRMAGPPLEVRGATLDPLMQLIGVQGKKQPHITTLSPEEARAGIEDAARSLQGTVPRSVMTRDDALPGPAGEIPLRLYSPQGEQQPLPITVFFHFGGYVIGSRNICDGFCGLLADRARTVVVNVEYRLAPEHPFPAPVEDALAAYQWVVEHGASFGGDPNRVAVAGDSAGGQLAAVVSQEAKRQHWAGPACQLLIYPWLVPNSGLPSYTDYADAYPLDAATMEWFGERYFTAAEQKDHPWAAPLHEAHVAGLPEAIIITAGFDPLRDEGEAYAERLKEAGVPVLYRCYEHLPHSFTMFGGVAPAAQQAMIEIADELKSRLHP